MRLYRKAQQMQLTPEENQILMSIRSKLMSAAPEIGDIMANQRSKAILFAVLDALGSVNPSQLKSILNKMPAEQPVNQQGQQGMQQQGVQQ